MKGKRFSIGLALLLIPLLAISCTAGVSQEEHDKVKSDLAVVQAQVESLQSDSKAAKSQLETLQSVNDNTKSDLAAAQAQVESLQSDSKIAKSQLETVRSLYDEARRFALVVAQQEAGTISDEYTMAKNVVSGLLKSSAGCPLCSGGCGMSNCDCFVYEPLPPME